MQLWAELFGLTASKISTCDNFFHVGGDSILAMRLVAAARQQGLQLTVSDIFSHPRLSGMASVAIANDASEKAIVDIPALVLLGEAGRESILQATEQQCSVGTTSNRRRVSVYTIARRTDISLDEDSWRLPCSL